MKPIQATMLFSLRLLLLQILFQLQFIHSFPVLLKPNDTDKSALLVFKSHITKDPFQVLSSWNHSSHWCKWLGVTCGKRHQRVTKLELINHHLEGSLTPYIGNLSFLRILVLHNNSLSGPIPPELGRLFRLQVLSLYYNMFDGEVPSNISYCFNLVHLNLGENRQLTGQIPPQLGSLARLKQMVFEKNHMVGTIPDSLGNLSSLEKFYVADNNLHGSIPEGFGQLKRLQEFAVGANNLSGTVPPSMYNITFLRLFSLADNNFSGSLPSHLFQSLPHIENFGIARNDFNGLVPETLSNASNLQILEIAYNNFIGKMPSLVSSHNLRGLTVVENSLGGGEDSDDIEFLHPLVNNTSLEYLYLDYNNFGGVIPESISNFSKKLWAMGFAGNQFRGTLPTGIGNLVSLQMVDFEQNKLSGNIPSSTGKLVNLIELSFSGNQLSGSIPTELGNITLMEQFYVEFNNLQGRIPASLGNWKSLFIFNSASNNITGSIPNELLDITSLVYLYLQENQLVGSIPTKVQKLVNLEDLDLSWNKLSGEVQGSLGACVHLQFLQLQENFFNGTIPVSFGSLKGLQLLNLSHNRLSGQIPNFLEDLKLSNLDLSFNDFDGEVPTRGVFQNESAVSVVGNKKLCGGVSSSHLPRCTINRSMEKKATNSFKFKILVSCGAVTILLGVVSLAICASRRNIPNPKPNSLSSKGIFFPQVSYQDLVKAIDGFSSINLIGVGSFGSVYRGVLMDETVVAVKVLNLLQRGAAKSFAAECETLINIRHRNLVKVLTVCSSIDHQGNDFKALIYEYMANGNLETWLHPPHIFDEAERSEHLNLVQRLEIAIDVASAIEYLHYHCQDPIVHCDLKPSNVLLDKNMTAHIGDFGLARILIEDDSQPTSTIATNSTCVKGTVGYTAPEYGIGSEVSTYGDVYSYGILLLEIFTGKRPTDDMFIQGLSLHNYVKMALPDHVADVLDKSLLREMDQETRGEYSHKLNSAREIHNMESAISILSIGLACSAEIPRERMNISNVVTKLIWIKDVFMRIAMHQCLH